MGAGCCGGSSAEKHAASSDSSHSSLGSATSTKPAQGFNTAKATDQIEVESLDAGSLPLVGESQLKAVGDQPDEISERSVPRSSASSERKGLNRLYSVNSEKALKQLGELEARLCAVEKRVGELNRQARSLLEAGRGGAPGSPTEGGLGKIKTELALLEAEAHQLESSGVDNVYTSELNSGKSTAKERKKGQLGRLEALFEQIDEVFKAIQGPTY
mmetsp:Transcript_41698/g.107971  ORF Transcript_41698/g.107971 Transcript_41698/m.107971 type:complete len:215 (-) Transcript_41698:198-842(-)